MAQILVIDDDSYVRDMLVEVLEPEGFSVLTAANGRKGMELQRETPCELVITDLFMPEQEGLETIQQLRQEFPDTKIIAISGGTPKLPIDFLPIAETLGADLTIAKPFRRKELLDAIQAAKPGIIPDHAAD